MLSSILVAHTTVTKGTYKYVVNIEIYYVRYFPARCDCSGIELLNYFITELYRILTIRLNNSLF